MEIKRGTTPNISVRFKGMDADADVASAEFVFKQECSEDAPELDRIPAPAEALSNFELEELLK